MKKNQILNKISNRKKALLFLLPLTAISAFASSANKWEDILPTSGGSGFQYMREDLEDKIAGNLGKLIAVLGFLGAFISYIVSHKGSVLVLGVVISLIAGGLVGIIGTFFNVGAAGFEPNSA